MESVGQSALPYVENLCPTCGVETSLISNPESNLLLYSCNNCKSQYYEEPLTQPPMPIDKPQSCNLCGRMFSHSSGLKRHFAVHTGERPFMCETCQKSFKTKAALKRHEIIHTGECPYECSTCKRRFNQISNLRKHLLIHNNTCPFYCSNCGKGFNQLSNLKKHLVVHEQRQVGETNARRTRKTGCGKKNKRPMLTFVKPADD